MAEIIKEELNIEEFEIKEEIVSTKEEILTSSTVEDTCTVNINKDYVKVENADIPGKLHVCHNYSLKCKYTLFSALSSYFEGSSDFIIYYYNFLFIIPPVCYEQ